MKILKLLFYCTFLIFQFGNAQGGEYNDVYGLDVINPKFNGGGLDKFHEFINQEFNFSKVTKQEKMIIAFTIDINGDVKGIKVVEFIDVEMATEIIRVLKKSPKWQPATRGGKPFSVEIKLPLDFKTNEANKKLDEKLDQKYTITANQIKLKDSVSKISTIDQEEIFESKPEYVGGMKSFYKFISKNYKAPDVEGLKGTVIVSFVVEKDGSLTDFKIDKDIGYGTGKEAIRVLKKSPSWIPATQKGLPVRCLFSLPIVIRTR